MLAESCIQDSGEAVPYRKFYSWITH